MNDKIVKFDHWGNYYPYMYSNKNCDVYLDIEGKFMGTGQLGWSLASTPVYNSINSPRTINLTAAGLRKSDIEIKEVNGQLTVKTKTGLTGHYTNLNQTYNLKNVQLDSSILKLGVLTLEFVDTGNVVRHEIKEVQ